MNIFGQTISVLIGLSLLGALGIGGYFVIEYIVALFFSMDIQVAKVTAITSVVVLLAATFIASSIRQASKQNNANQFHANKAETYKLFVDTWSKLLQERTGSVKQNARVLFETLQALEQSLALYGSPAVIKAHTALRVLVADSGTQNPEIMRQFSKALQEVRKDLGSDTNGLAPEELCGLVLHDSGQPENDSAGLVRNSR